MGALAPGSAQVRPSGPNLIWLIAKGYAQIVSDVLVDVSDVSEVIEPKFLKWINQRLSGNHPRLFDYPRQNDEDK